MADQSPSIYFGDIPLDEARHMSRSPRMDPELYNALKQKIQSLDNTATRLTTPEGINPTTMRNVHRMVRRLQMRIAKATRAGRWNKVKALQHLLTHSLSTKALALKQVTENHGKWISVPTNRKGDEMGVPSSWQSPRLFKLDTHVNLHFMVRRHLHQW